MKRDHYVALTGCGTYRLLSKGTLQLEPLSGRTRPAVQGVVGGGRSMADELAEGIINKIKAHADPGAGEVTLETELTDLGIHSLELTEIIFDIEDEFGVEIDMNTSDAWNNLNDVNDIVTAVRGLIDKKS
jgi:nodulation protein F